MELEEFDPFDESLDINEVLALHEKLSSKTSSEHSTLPLFQYSAAQSVLQLKDSIQNGDGFDLLLAVRKCGTHGLVFPEWLSYAFNRSFDQVLNCHTNSWDVAFGKPYPNKKIHDLRRRRELCFAIYNRVSEIKASEPQTPIDKSLFERVGRESGTGATLTEELYYLAKRRADPHYSPAKSRK